MQLGGHEIYISLTHTQPALEQMNAVVRSKTLCTVLGPSGSGKTALVQYWRSSGLATNLQNTVYVQLVPVGTTYRSSRHMLYAQVQDALHNEFAPAYVPRRYQRTSSTERAGKKPVERLRKEVMRELNDRPVRVIILDDIEYFDGSEIDAARELMFAGGKKLRALILVGQKREGNEKKQITYWLNKFSATREEWRGSVTLSYPTLEELRATAIRPLIGDGIKANVPDDAERPRTNQRIGAIIEATKGNWSSIALVMKLIDDYAETDASGATRPITKTVVDRVIDQLRPINPGLLSMLDAVDSNTPQPSSGSNQSVLSLSKEERLKLEQARDEHEKLHVRERAAALLQAANGKSYAEAGASLTTPRSADTVREWTKRFKVDGIVGIETKPGQGRKSKQLEE